MALGLPVGVTNILRPLAPALVILLALVVPAFAQDKEAAGQAADRVDASSDQPKTLQVAPFVVDRKSVRSVGRKQKRRDVMVPLQVIQCDAEGVCRPLKKAPKKTRRSGDRTRK